MEHVSIKEMLEMTMGLVLVVQLKQNPVIKVYFDNL